MLNKGRKEGKREGKRIVYLPLASASEASHSSSHPCAAEESNSLTLHYGINSQISLTYMSCSLSLFVSFIHIHKPLHVHFWCESPCSTSTRLNYTSDVSACSCLRSGRRFASCCSVIAEMRVWCPC